LGAPTARLPLNRYDSLCAWAQSLFPGKSIELAPASSDASFRRYFRLQMAGEKLTYIIMDAPPEHEDCGPFVRVAELFGAAGACVPQVLAQDLAQGFLLLSDLGASTFLSVLERDAARASALYVGALEALVRIQSASKPDVLPPYDEALLMREMQLFPDWYVARHRNTTLDAREATVVNAAFKRLTDASLAQAQVYVHRDYHSRNLMVDGPAAPGEIGVLDFQDAVYGPVTYDLVSLLKDAYIEWDEPQVLDWAVRYWELARKAGVPVPSDFGIFYRDFEWMGLQRHLKVLGIFARLNYRDGKAQYLNDMPLVLKHVRAVCRRYDEFGPLLRVIERVEGTVLSTRITF
jgi:N-acetylmuramate 1-kinase